MELTRESHTDASRRWEHGLLLLALLLGTLLRLPGFQRSLWLDEVISVQTAALAPQQVVEAARRDDTHPPGYYLLLSLWQRALPGDDGARGLSLVLSLAAVLAAAAVARELAGGGRASAWAGPAAGLLVAVSPGTVWIGYEARSFALLALLLTLAWLGALRVLAGRGRSGAVLLALSSAGALWTHYYAAVAAAGLLAFTLCAPAARQRKALVLLAAGAGALLFAPWIPSLLEQLERVRRATADGRAAVSLTPYWLGTRWIGHHLLSAGPWGSAPAAVGLGLVLGLRALRLRWVTDPPGSAPLGAGDAHPWIRPVLALVTAYVLGVLCFGLVGGFVGRRYTGFLSVAYAVLAALLLTRVPPRLARALLLGLALGAAWHALEAAFRAERQDWSGAAARVEALADPSQAVGVWPAWDGPCLRRNLPAAYQPAVLELGAWRPDPSGVRRARLDASQLPQITALLREQRQFVFVVDGREDRDGPDAGPPLLRRHLASLGFAQSERVELRGLALEVWRR